jgi:urease subunit gamma/beta
MTPSDADRLLLFTQAQLARSRQARGLRLNAPEATAIIADAICEWARDGLDLDDARVRGGQLLSVHDVLPGVPEVVTQVRVEARFDDGSRLVVVNDPFGVGVSSVEELTVPAGGIPIVITNTSATAIGISSHIHLAEINPRLRLDRGAAFGMRLAAPTGDTAWLDPGETVELLMIPIGGARVMMGNTGVVDGPLDDPAARERALETLRACGYLDIVDGMDVNADSAADSAVARLMATR